MAYIKKNTTKGKKKTMKPDEAAETAIDTLSAEIADKAVCAYLEKIDGYPHLDTDRESQLAQRAAEGDIEAKQKLTEANLYEVVKIAKKFVGQGMTIMDLISEGNLGLMKAVEKYDLAKGSRFSDYALLWIKQSITRALADQSRTIRLPVHKVETIHMIKRVSRQILQRTGREATPDEIGQELGMSADEVRANMRNEVEFVPPDITIADTETPQPDEVSYNALLREDLNRVLGFLTPREERVIKLRYGLEDGSLWTLDDIGREFGSGRERIHQILLKAERKLKHPRHANELKGYILL